MVVYLFILQIQINVQIQIHRTKKQVRFEAIAISEVPLMFGHIGVYIYEKQNHVFMLQLIYESQIS